MEKLKRLLSIGLNILVAVAVPTAWLMMMLALPEGPLSSRGIGSLKYFTVLSNIFASAASIFYLVNTRFEAREPSKLAASVKYISAAAVGLTFFTVLLFLGPVYGFVEYGLYTGGNIWLHLFVPLAAMADAAFFDNCPVTDFRATFGGVIPAAVYGAFYGSNLLINGVEGNDFYGFAIGGVLGSVLMGLAVVFLCWLVSIMLWALKRFSRRKTTISK